MPVVSAALPLTRCATAKALRSLFSVKGLRSVGLAWGSGRYTDWVFVSLLNGPEDCFLGMNVRLHND